MSRLAAIFCVLALTAVQITSHAQMVDEGDSASWLDELDPTDPNTPALLRQMDLIYEAETGESAFLPAQNSLMIDLPGITCERLTCPVWARVNKVTQTLSLYLDSNPVPAMTWPVSTGIPGRQTKDFDKHPDGRIYNHYSSHKFPGGDYNGLGNMPYAVFISGGYAIHGTPRKNWVLLGKKASHGCVRIHPDNAKYFNQLVRANGVANVWITVE